MSVYVLSICLIKYKNIQKIIDHSYFALVDNIFFISTNRLNHDYELIVSNNYVFVLVVIYYVTKFESNQHHPISIISNRCMD